MRSIHLAGATAAVLTTLAVSASADTMTLTYVDAGPSRAVSYTYDSATGTATGGVLNFVGGVRTFCTQFLQNVGGTNTFDVVDVAQVPEGSTSPGPMGEARATLIRDLYARNYGTVMAATGDDARNQAAAFSMVIWEITHQDSLATTAAGILDDLDIATGNAVFTAGTTIDGIAATMIANLGGGTDSFMSYGVAGLTNASAQDMLIVVPGPAGLAAVLGLAGVRGRRRRN